MSDESDAADESDSSARGAESGTSSPEVDGDAPLADLARRVSDRRREREPETDGTASTTSHGVESGRSQETSEADADDPFRKVSVAEVDEESLWSSLAAGTEPTVAVGPSAPADPDSGVDGAESTTEPNEHVVSKGDYCQKCPYLHEPPELACTHEGTEIVAVEDTDHFRVRNCPMVRE